MSAARRSAAGSNGKGIGCLVLLVLIPIGWISQVAGCGGTKPTSNALPAYTAPSYTPTPYPTNTYVSSTPDSYVPSVAGGDPAASPDDQTLAADPGPTEDAVPLPDAPDPNAVDVVPGDTALCRDGKITHPLHHRGACSHNGGVAQWI